MNSELASGIMFVKGNIKILGKHYEAVTSGSKLALPRELAGIPVVKDDEEDFAIVRVTHSVPGRKGATCCGIRHHQGRD